MVAACSPAPATEAISNGQRGGRVGGTVAANQLGDFEVASCLVFAVVRDDQYAERPRPVGRRSRGNCALPVGSTTNAPMVGSMSGGVGVRSASYREEIAMARARARARVLSCMPG